jgi:hypothetical protein
MLVAVQNYYSQNSVSEPKHHEDQRKFDFIPQPQNGTSKDSSMIVILLKGSQHHHTQHFTSSMKIHQHGLDSELKNTVLKGRSSPQSAKAMNHL